MEEKNAVSAAHSAGKAYLYRMLVWTLAIVAAVTIYQSVNGNGSVEAQLGEEYLGIGGTEESVFVYYSEILSAELLDEFEPGSCLNGLDGKQVCNGTYENDTLGTCQVFAYRNVSSYIVVYHTDGILVFNLNKASKTEAFYEQLCTYLE